MSLCDGYLLDAPRIEEYADAGNGFIEGVPYQFTVQKNNSHAWVEVWFDDFGWLTFEPTSRYSAHQVLGYPEDAKVIVKEFDDLEFEKIVVEEVSNDIYLTVFGIILMLLVVIIVFIRIIIIVRRSEKEKIANHWKSIKETIY